MSQECTVWVADDDKSIRWVLEKTFAKQSINCLCFEGAESLLQALEQASKADVPDVILSDVRMEGMDGLSMMKIVHEHMPDLPVIIMTAHSDLDSAVSSFQGGAFEYLPKPFDLTDAVSLVQRAFEHGEKLKQKKQQQQPKLEPIPVTDIIGEAPAMQEVFRAIGRLSQSHINVLINGQSGTGKELVANALHRHSPRKDKAFIALNMAAIPKDLMESELFGHEKGAFTGASVQRKGRFEQADGGTLFLDEIGDMPSETQTRLLRVLSDGVFYRVGGHIPVKVDVRIVAATHQNLEELVKTGDFREDLFHRLNVIRIHIPKLADRSEDIPKLLQHFLRSAGKELRQTPKILSEEALQFLCALTWPGNVRQLENFCRWITVMASGQRVMLQDLPPELKNEIKDALKNDYKDGWQEAKIAGQSGTTNQNTTTINNDQWPELLHAWVDQKLSAGESNILQQAVPLFEKTLLDIALLHTKGRKKDAADLLGWGRNTLTRKLKELNMDSKSND